MKFVFLVLGKSKFSFVENGVEHYLSSIQHFAQAELIELKDHGSQKDKEATAIEDALKKRKLSGGKSKVYLLDEKGKEFSSLEFARHLGNQFDQGMQTLVFVVGGAYGFAESLRDKFSLISLSKMTFPHDLARLILMEQIYRGLHILSGGKYHHGE